MATFIVLLDYTDQGIRNLKDSPQRADAFNQFAILPYIGDGSPVTQRFWVDDMTAATARPGRVSMPICKQFGA